MNRRAGSKRTKRVKIPKRTYEVLVTVTDDGDDGAGGYAYLTKKQIKGLVTEGARHYAGVDARAVAVQELPLREV